MRNLKFEGTWSGGVGKDGGLKYHKKDALCGKASSRLRSNALFLWFFSSQSFI